VLDLNIVSLGLTPMLRRMIGEHIVIATNTDARLGLVLADQGQIEQVIMNLAVNARDAMPGGGTITVETANVELGGWRTTDFRAYIPPGPYSMLAVSDTGCGMDAATQARVFEPFFTTKEPGRGTGLGLATVYGIVKQSGGFIWVYSELGHGTTFKVYLPHAQAAVIDTGRVTGPVLRPRGTETILLVEDEDAVRRLTSRVLSGQGYTVLEARSGIEALALVVERGRAIDLVITDVVMPELNGGQLAERIQEVYPTLRVIYMSGYTDNDIVRRGLLDPQVAFIQKPFTADALACKVREVLDAVEQEK
jgi:CheY-like chemotaxis protein